VWANGKEMRFYINGELQFSVKDPSLSAGSLGVFIRSAGDNAVTVSFADLVVRAIDK
jgi:predicted membrane-bound spermidine synthase